LVVAVAVAVAVALVVAVVVALAVVVVLPRFTTTLSSRPEHRAFCDAQWRDLLVPLPLPLLLPFLFVIPEGNLRLPLPLLLPLFLPLFVFRRHPERSEGPPYWLLQLQLPLPLLLLLSLFSP
jgi:hypothetical protein